MYRRNRLFQIIILTTFILFFIFFLSQKLTLHSSYNYIYSGERIFSTNQIKNIVSGERNSLQTFNGHPIFYEPDGECLWDSKSQNVKSFLEQNGHNELVKDASWCLPNGVTFYVGYFKTIEEAIHFGEYNYQNVTEYLYKITDIPHRDDLKKCVTLKKMDI